MNLLLVAILLQSAVILPDRTILENPSILFPVPKKLQKDYDKIWTRFLTGKQDQVVLTDVGKLLKKDEDLTSGLMIQFYVHYYSGRYVEAEQSLQQVLLRQPSDRFSLYYLAESAFGRDEFARAGLLYGQLLAVESRPDLETKHQKSILLAMQDLLDKARRASEANQLAEAEELYRQALQFAPREPGLHGQLANLLSQQGKWEAAIEEYQRQMELGGPSPDAERGIAHALTKLGRGSEARTRPDTSEPASASQLDQKVAELEELGRWGNERGRFRDIASAPTLNREQFAWILLRYFPQVAELRQSPQVVTDVQDSWARPEIQTMLGLGLLEPLPNHTFQPTETLARTEFATAVARLSRLLGVIPTDAPPKFTPGVAPESDLYRDLQLVEALGLLPAEEAANPSSARPPSGKEAVIVAEKLLRLVALRSK